MNIIRLQPRMQEPLRSLVQSLLLRRQFFLEMASKPPGFAEGYANGLNEAIEEIRAIIDQAGPLSAQPEHLSQFPEQSSPLDEE